VSPPVIYDTHVTASRRIGLARALSKLGYCSRSQACDLIRAGRVTLNGAVPRDPETPVNLESDRILNDGHPVAASASVYLMLNKPRGLVTTASDEKGRRTVYDCLPTGLPWLAPVGRLDKASEGLLLLTNDSEWAARITAPESHLDKAYHVLRWQPVWGFARGVEATARWYRRVARDGVEAAVQTRADLAAYMADAASAGVAWAVTPPRREAPDG